LKEHLKKRIDSLENSNNLIRSSENDGGKKDKYGLDTGKFVDKNIFAEHEKFCIRELHQANLRIEELKIKVDDILNSLKNKVSDHDLRSLDSMF